MRRVALLIAAGALSACAAPDTQPSATQPVQPGEPQTPAMIEKDWVGKTVTARTAAGRTGELKLMANGAASWSSRNFSDSGTWRLDEQGYCTKWQKTRSGAEECYTVVRRDQAMFVNKRDGSLTATVLGVR